MDAEGKRSLDVQLNALFRHSTLPLLHLLLASGAHESLYEAIHRLDVPYTSSGHREDVAATVAALQAEGIEVTRPISDQGWGLLTAIALPGGVELGLYQPRHPTEAQPS